MSFKSFTVTAACVFACATSSFAGETNGWVLNRSTSGATPIMTEANTAAVITVCFVGGNVPKVKIIVDQTNAVVSPGGCLTGLANNSEVTFDPAESDPDKFAFGTYKVEGILQP